MVVVLGCPYYAPEPLFVNFIIFKEVCGKKDLQKSNKKCYPMLSFKIEHFCGIPKILK
jgi:hypothetical protein